MSAVAKAKNNAKTQTKTRKPPQKRARSSTRLTTKKATKPKRNLLFLCECMAVGVFFVAFGAASWARVRQLQSTQTQVLGISTKLDTSTILGDLNLQRAKSGLGPVTLNEQLNAAALAKGENMFSEDYWAHVSPSGTEPWAFIQEAGYAYQSAGENLARDFSNEEALVQAWMASPSHRANVLNANFTEVGLAVLDGQINGQDVLLIVNLFAQPKSAVAVAATASYYDDTATGQVLGGEVIPSGGSLASHPGQFNFWQTLFISVIGGGMIMVFVKLHRWPTGVRKKA